MTAKPDDALEKLIHDVRSKCDSLRAAAGLLRDSPPGEREHLLGLMERQARSLASLLAARVKGRP